MFWLKNLDKKQHFFDIYYKKRKYKRKENNFSLFYAFKYYVKYSFRLILKI